MFEDLKNAFEKMLKNCSHISTSQGVHIVFPENIFSEFEQEFNICFVEEEEDQDWQRYQFGQDFCCGGDCDCD